MTVRIWAAATVSLALFACNSSDFNGAGGKKPAVEKKKVDDPQVTKPNANPQPGTPVPPDAKQETESFAIAQSEGLIDMVWLIDNSGSMREEASQVRDNFDKFLSTIQARSDMRIALISSKDRADSLGGSTGVTLPFSAEQAGGIQIDSYVDSTNALMLAAMATCPANTTVVPPENSEDPFATATGKTCGKELALDFFASSLYKDVPGVLSTFFRPQAKKVYVIVTDDTADTVNDTNFLELIRPYQGAVAPSVFAFIGTESKDGCDIAQRGTPYEALAAKTEGATFDICEKDWTKNFDKLSKAVIGLASAQFMLKATTVGQIVSVTVDGKPLAAGSFTVAGNVVTLDQKQMPTGAKTLLVTYVKP